MSELKYRRILLKLSGEALMGNADYGIDPETVRMISMEVKEIQDLGAETAIVIGGGISFGEPWLDPSASTG